MNAIQCLESIEKYDRMIQDNYDRLADLQDRIDDITAKLDIEPVQSSGNSDKVGNLVVKIQTLKEEIAEQTEQLVFERERIIRMIGQIQKPMYYTVLYQRYVKYKSLTEISIKYNYSYQHICNIKNLAVTNFQMILDSEAKKIKDAIKSELI